MCEYSLAMGSKVHISINWRLDVLNQKSWSKWKFINNWGTKSTINLYKKEIY